MIIFIVEKFSPALLKFLSYLFLHSIGDAIETLCLFSKTPPELIGKTISLADEIRAEKGHRDGKKEDVHLLHTPRCIY